MTVFKIYSENGKQISETDEPITVTNLPLFQKEYSPEHIQGYLQCLEDLIGEIEPIVLKEPEKIFYAANTPEIVQQKLSQLYQEKIFLRRCFESSGITLPQPSVKSIPPQ